MDQVNAVTAAIPAAFLAIAIYYLLYMIFNSRVTRNHANAFQFSVGTILLWSRNVEASMEQVKRNYEWQIDQWAGFAKVILAASLAFVSAVAASLLKGEVKDVEPVMVAIISLGLVCSLLAYAICQSRVSRLRIEFLSIYNLLEALR